MSQYKFHPSKVNNWISSSTDLKHILSERNETLKMPDIGGFINDNTIVFLKSQLQQHFESCQSVNPVDGLTFEQYLIDLKNLHDTNPYALELVEDNEKVLIFRFENYEPILLSNIADTIPNLKNFLVHNQSDTGLRCFTMNWLWKDSNNNPKIVDITTLWYYNYMSNMYNINVMAVLDSRSNTTETSLYTFGEVTEEMQTAIDLSYEDRDNNYSDITITGIVSK